MTTLLGTTCSGCVTLGFSSSEKFRTSQHGVSQHGVSLLTPSVKKAPHKSSFWGSSSIRLFIPTAASDSLTTKGSSLITTAASLEEQQLAKKGATSGGTREATSPVVASAAEEMSTSYSSGVSAADIKAWKAIRASRKTSRRRALAFTLALAGLSQNGPSSEAHDQSSDAQARDLIRVSQNTAPDVAAPTLSPAIGDQYGDLVTVSTGSGPSNDGNVKGLPSWMRGNYHLCMGDGFHVQLPSDWFMHDTEGRVYGTVLRYEDRADPSTNVVVLRSPTRVGNLGNPEDWIREQAYLLSGSNEPLQFQSGDVGTDAPRKFPSGRVSIAKVLRDEPKDKQGLTYYNYEILTKQGGKQTNVLHELVSAVVNDGNLYMCRVQTGEGRWQGDSKNTAQRIVDSFQITGFKVRA